MKRQRLRFKLLAVFLFLLFGALAVYGSYSVLTYGNRWFSSIRNPRVRTQREQVIPGDILDTDGVVLASTDPEGNRRYAEDPAVRRALVHLVGDRQGHVSNGVETFQTSYLYGFQASLLDQVGDLLAGNARTGDSVQLTVSAPLTAALADAFRQHETTAGKPAAAVILNWKTGAVAALTSLPSFDPEDIGGTVDAGDKAFWNRVTQARIPPGSTFKIVTAASALDHLPQAREVTVTCSTDVLDFGGHTIGDYGGEAHGTVDLRSAFTQSCNKMFATLAMNLGAGDLRQTAEQFGFNDNFLFRDLVVENSSFPERIGSDYELAACGFGQSSITATPLHLCMIAAGVANGGVMMEPRLLQRVTSASGSQRLGFSSAEYRTCMSPETAALLGEYMRGAVTGGTGWRAAVPGLTVCGKTGTADSTDGGEPIVYGWFAGYIADEELPYAIAVVVEGLDSGTTGGSTAALVAHDAFLWLRDHRPDAP
ncbi:MAG: penicillin-binding protein 2 [Clostridia bacterium]|nr:penicillin-binding protein 2 [Clostridia bacterium]